MLSFLAPAHWRVGVEGGGKRGQQGPALSNNLKWSVALLMAPN